MPLESRYVRVRIKGVEHHFWLDEAREALRDLEQAIGKAPVTSPTPPVDTPRAGQHPTQPLEVDPSGVVRFRANKILTYLLQTKAPLDMHELSKREEFTDEDRMQLAQLLGYSVSGYGELSYVTEESFQAAERQVPALLAAVVSTETGTCLLHPDSIPAGLGLRAQRNAGRDAVRTVFEASGLGGKIEVLDRPTFGSVLCILPERMESRLPQEYKDEAVVLDVMLSGRGEILGYAELENSGAILHEIESAPMTLENAKNVASELVQWAQKRRFAQASSPTNAHAEPPHGPALDKSVR